VVLWLGSCFVLLVGYLCLGSGIHGVQFDRVNIEFAHRHPCGAHLLPHNHEWRRNSAEAGLLPQGLGVLREAAAHTLRTVLMSPTMLMRRPLYCSVMSSSVPRCTVRVASASTLILGCTSAMAS